MYTYITAMAQATQFDGQFKPVNILTQTLVSIYRNYTSVYVTLHNDGYDREETLHLADLPFGVQSSEQTLQQWLLANGDNTLPTTWTAPALTTNRVQFYDATYAGFKLTPGSVYYHPDTQLSDQQKVDVYVTKSGVDYLAIRDHCIFTVNGYLHLADASVNGLIVYDAMRSQKNLRENHLGILDFHKVGKLSFHPILPEHLSKRSELLNYSDVLYLDLPVAPAGKTVLLSIGGFLHTPDSLFTLVGDRTLKIDFKRFNWLERFYLLNQALGKEWSGLEHQGDTFVKDEVFSDATITKLFTLKQSFVVLVDTPRLFVNRYPVELTGLPGHYYSHEKIGLPLVGSEGLLKEYKHGKYDGVFTLDTQGYLIKTNVLHTTGWWDESQVVSNTVDPNRKTHLSHAHWLLIANADEGSI